MKALSKAQMKEKATLVDDIRAASTELETAIKAYNAVMATEQAKVNEKQKDLNSKIQEAKEWIEGVSSDMQSCFDLKSEKWQESENGQNYASWQESYENFDADDVSIYFPEEIEEPECAAADDLESLSDEP